MSLRTNQELTRFDCYLHTGSCPCDRRVFVREVFSAVLILSKGEGLANDYPSFNGLTKNTADIVKAVGEVIYVRTIYWCDEDNINTMYVGQLKIMSLY